MRCPKSRFPFRIILFDELELIIFVSQDLTLSTASLVINTKVYREIPSGLFCPRCGVWQIAESDKDSWPGLRCPAQISSSLLWQNWRYCEPGDWLQCFHGYPNIGCGDGRIFQHYHLDMTRELCFDSHINQNISHLSGKDKIKCIYVNTLLIYFTTETLCLGH